MPSFWSVHALHCDRVVDVIIQQNPSKFAMAEDLWTSKNSVYAFCGSMGWLIDDEWRLREFVLDLLALDGDHSGAASGRLMFNSLKNRELIRKFSRCLVSAVIGAI